MPPTKCPPRSLKILFGCLALASLVGCESLENMMPETQAPKMPASKRLQLQAIDHAHAVRFPADRAGLLSGEAERLLGFLRQRARAARYTLFVIPEPLPASAPPTLGDDRAETVAAYLESRGFHTQVLPSGAPVASARADGDVRVMVRSYTITLPGCPDWSTDPSHSFDNVVHSNWGCATATNLGMMVADPADLARGRQPGDADGELLSKRVDDYRKGETKALDPEDVGTIESQQKSGGGGQ